MIANPRKGQIVQIWYAAKRAPFMPYHGQTGAVRIVSRGPGPRNHGVKIPYGDTVAVPCGNLRVPK